MSEPDPLVVAVRSASLEYGLRVEVSSDPRLPVAMCDQGRLTYGFGLSLDAAFAEYERRRKLKEARKEGGK